MEFMLFNSAWTAQTKQRLHKQHNTGGLSPQVKTLLSTQFFEDNNVNILAREDRWFERGVKKIPFVKLERPSLNRGGGLRHYHHPPTMQYRVPSPDSLTTIHTFWMKGERLQETETSQAAYDTALTKISQQVLQ